MAEKQKKPIYKRKWFIAIVVIIVLGAIFSPKEEKAKVVDKPKSETSQEEAKEETKEETKPEEKVAYEITDLKVDESGFTPKATGILKNNTDSDKSYIQITFAVKDKDGNKLGSAMANINNLKAGDTWKFEAMSFSTDEGQIIDLEDYEVEGF